MTACTPALREALNDSISSGRFADTKIILFSHRSTSGAICKPKALYASSHVLRTLPYFSDLLFGQFGEAEPKDFPEPLDDDESADDYGYCSDSDLEEDDDSASSNKSSKQNSLAAGSNLPDPFYFPPIENEPAPTCGEYEGRLKKGKIIKVQDMAFVTFQAFVLYLYTNSIKFAPYGSEHNRKSRSVEIISVTENSIPRPSPKSMYRLADKYDVPALKQLALESIKNGLGRCNIVEEIFSKFTSRYNEIRAMQINHLISVRIGGDEGITKKLCDQIDEKVDAYVAGDLKHAAGAMSLLWGASKKDKYSTPAPRSASIFGLPKSNDVCGAPPSTSTSTPALPATSPTNWECVNSALIRSIREGVFADRKYWTRHSKAGKALRPVYFSSIVAGAKLPYVERLVKQYHRSDEYFGKDDRFEDSDYEVGLDQSEDSVAEAGVNSGGRSDEGTLPVLTIGSYASWRSLFFYLCARLIEFAPLKSQGLEMRARYIQEKADKDPHAPPPCSPKTIHSLAVALGIKPLQDLALKEIESKITSANIVDEFFASPTSRRTEVMKMQYELLRDKFDNQLTNSSAVDLIESMADGTHTHHASALKFGLREGLSRAKVMPPEPEPAPQFSMFGAGGGGLQSSTPANAKKQGGRFR